MDPTSSPHDPLAELSDALRPAVEQVRSEPEPAEVVARALDRARRLRPTTVSPWPAYHRLAVAAAAAAVALAALLLVAVFIWPGQPQEERRSWIPVEEVEITDANLVLRPPVAREPASFPGHSGAGREAYDHIIENPFLATARNPLSTFSVDVHTASYSNVRRFLLQEGRLPPPDAVRIAELINYFPYDYPPPAGEHPVAFALDVADCPWQPRHHLVRIGLRAGSLDPSKLPPRNLVFLVDTSGSMAGPNRLPLLKQSLHLLVDRLGEADRVALVAYAGSAGLVLPSTPGSDRDAIHKAIDRLDAGGSTNGGEGITLAYRVAREHFVPGGVNRVILGTDGDFNVGVTNRGDLVRLIEEQRQSGVYLTVLGLGMGNLKDATLEELAHHGGGHYAYLDNLDEARKVFVEQGASLVTVARDVKLQIEFNPRRVGAYRLIGYENRLLRDRDFNDDRKHATDLGIGHTVTALYEVVPTGRPLPGPKVDPLRYQQGPQLAPAADSNEWLTVRLRYKDPGTAQSKLLHQTLAGPAQKMEQALTDFRFQAAVASFGLLLRGSEHRGRARYADTLALARASLGADPGGHRAAFLRLVEKADTLTRTRK